MTFLGQAAPRFLRGFEIAVGVEPQHLKRAHFVRAAAAVALAAPAIMLGAGIAARAACFARRALGGLLGAQPGEIVPAAIIFGGVAFAEIPAIGAVRRLGRRAIAGLGAAVAVANADLLRLARRTIGAPARKTPIVGSLGAAHPAHVTTGSPHC